MTTTSATTDSSSSMTTSLTLSEFVTTPTSTTTTTSGPAATSPAALESSGLGAGAIAGIAIGCLIAGVLLGAVAAWILLRRKRQWEPPQSASYYPVKNDTQEKLAPIAAPSNRSLDPLDQFLMDVKPDRELVSELRSLDRSIQRHVAEHYHTQPVPDGAVNPEDLALVLVKLGIDSTIGQGDGNAQQSLARHLSHLALNPSTRFQTLRHVIMSVAFGSTALRSSSSISMLPPFVAAFARHLSESEPELGQQRGKLDVFHTALTKWRQLSVYLLRHTNRPSTEHRAISPLSPSEDISTQQAQRLAEELNRFLAPFIALSRGQDLDDDDDDESDTLARYEQENDLRETLVECATFGYLLFSQPAEYGFAYSDGKRRVVSTTITTTKNNKGGGGDGGGEGEGSSRNHGEKIVVCPGLQRMGDEEGRRYASPQILMCPVVAEALVNGNTTSRNTIGAAI
ncbi:hypothetical protein PG985_009921 [Apiospora marii]|uniref:Uncharacterized protein n=1 Tax=Apiospora marii TaxID=335849 RepID=A0ABR1RQL8_9PEZI